MFTEFLSTRKNICCELYQLFRVHLDDGAAAFTHDHLSIDFGNALGFNSTQSVSSSSKYFLDGLNQEADHLDIKDYVNDTSISQVIHYME